MRALASSAPPATEQSLLVRALRGEPVERVPVWFMRQAGRSLPEYRELRRGRTLMELARTPELAAEVTLQPVRRHSVDAAILFSDIVVPLAATGVDVEIRPGCRPGRGAARTQRRGRAAPAAAGARRGHARARRDGAPAVLRARRAIGFAGGPFTLASYLIEGGPSKAQARTKALMLSDPPLFHEFLSRLARIAAAALRAQVEAGAAAIQVFDSWIGSLSREQYGHVAPVTRRLFAELADLGVPRIAFGIGTGHLLEAIAATGPDAMGLDWRTPLGEARHRLGPAMALQGNLDPTALLAPWSVLRAEASAVLAQAPRAATSSTSGTASFPRPRPTCRAGSSSSRTATRC
jgi:uroporphyrinogen decarboxylase